MERYNIQLLFEDIFFCILFFTTLTSFLLILIYKIWFKTPYNVKINSIDGFENSCPNRESDIETKERINELRKARKKGGLPPTYSNGWFAIMESDKVKVGQSMDVYALGQNLVVWRGQSGKAFLSSAYCPHLGAHLGVGGVVLNDCIKCPFHGWVFDGNSNGKLVEIPYSENEKTLESVRINLWECVEKFGIIFTWYHKNKEPPNWTLDQIPDLPPGWNHRGTVEFTTLCHVQEVAENIADLSHLNELHADLMSIEGDPALSRIKRNWIRHSFKGDWVPGPEIQATMNMKHDLLLLDRFKINGGTMNAVHYGPGILMMYMTTKFVQSIMVQCITPIKELKTASILRFHASPTSLQMFVKMLMDGVINTAYRDRRVMNRKTYPVNPIFVKEDRYIKQFRKWYSQFYSNDEINQD